MQKTKLFLKSAEDLFVFFCKRNSLNRPAPLKAKAYTEHMRGSQG